ncbi:hypothetical protein CSB11_02190 [Candidatus Campbellbacteria bacterium]|nr:MAG: hypothetical protein CSB11_02190 [Candidatus Campbellbacteria bacterium]
MYDTIREYQVVLEVKIIILFFENYLFGKNQASLGFFLLKFKKVQKNFQKKPEIMNTKTQTKFGFLYS